MTFLSFYFYLFLSLLSLQLSAIALHSLSWWYVEWFTPFPDFEGCLKFLEIDLITFITSNQLVGDVVQYVWGSIARHSDRRQMSNIDLILSNLIQHHIRQLCSIHFQWPALSPCTHTNAESNADYALFESVSQNVIKVSVCSENFTQIECCILHYRFFSSLLWHRLRIKSLWTPHIPSDKQLCSLIELLLGTVSPIRFHLAQQLTVSVLEHPRGSREVSSCSHTSPHQ